MIKVAKSIFDQCFIKAAGLMKNDRMIQHTVRKIDFWGMLPFSFHAIDKSQGEEVTEPTFTSFLFVKTSFSCNL